MLKKYKFSLLLVFGALIAFALSYLIGTRVDDSGFLHEPAFFLIPLGYLSLLSAGLTALYTKIKRKHDSR